MNFFVFKICPIDTKINIFAFKDGNQMEWTTMISILLGGGSLITSLLAIYTAKAKKIALEVQTMQEVIKTIQDERDKEAERHRQQDEERKREITELKTDMKLFEQRDMIQMAAIISANGCPLPSETKRCPVLVTYQEKCHSNDGVCKIK